MLTPWKAVMLNSMNAMFVVALLANQIRLPHVLLTVGLAVLMGLLASLVPARPQTPSSVHLLISVDAAPVYGKCCMLHPCILSMSRRSWPGRDRLRSRS